MQHPMYGPSLPQHGERVLMICDCRSASAVVSHHKHRWQHYRRDTAAGRGVQAPPEKAS